MKRKRQAEDKQLQSVPALEILAHVYAPVRGVTAVWVDMRVLILLAQE